MGRCHPQSMKLMVFENSGPTETTAMGCLVPLLLHLNHLRQWQKGHLPRECDLTVTARQMMLVDRPQTEIDGG